MTTKTITITADCELTVVLNGAGGGNGGSDAASRGAVGSPGDSVTCTVDAKAGERYYITTGGAGGNGSSSASNASGGGGGSGLTGFTGGSGGRAGNSGSSGGGGGGGGASVLYTVVGGETKYIAVAGGGAGGGGAGVRSYGVQYNSTKTRGVNAKYYSNTSYPVWSSVLNYYGVLRSGNYFVLTYDVYSETSQTCSLYASADNTGSMYVNGKFVNYAPGWDSVNRTTISLVAGWNTLTFYVTNWGGPKGLGAYVVNSSGNVIFHTRYSYNLYEQLNLAGVGQPGLKHPGDGGGGGGGGGGLYGGAGGSYRSGDNGAYSGSSGLSNGGIPSGVETPIREKWIATKRHSVNVFGGSNRGVDGSYTVSGLTTNINYKLNNQFRTVSEVLYRSGSEWIPCKDIYVRQNNQWVTLLKTDTYTIS